MNENNLSRYETRYYKILGRDEKGIYRASSIANSSDWNLRSAKVPYLEQFMPYLFRLHSKEAVDRIACPCCGGMMDRYDVDDHRKIVFLCIKCA